MRRNSKNLKALVHKLREMRDQGSLETAKVAQLVKAVRTLRRAVQGNDRRLIESTVDDLCRPGRVSNDELREEFNDAAIEQLP